MVVLRIYKSNIISSLRAQRGNLEALLSVNLTNIKAAGLPRCACNDDPHHVWCSLLKNYGIEFTGCWWDTTALVYIIFHHNRVIIMAKTSKLPRYKVLIDHVTSLEILDRESNQHVFKHPHDILFTDEYKDYSIEDAARVAFICGQICGSRQMKATAT